MINRFRFAKCFSPSRLLPELVLNENRCLCDRNWIIEQNLSGVTSCCDVMLLHKNRSTSFEDEFLDVICRRAYGCVMCHKYSSPDVNGQRMNGTKTHSPIPLPAASSVGTAIIFQVGEPQEVSSQAPGDDFCQLCRIFSRWMLVSVS